jgi:hypothetical protein
MTPKTWAETCSYEIWYKIYFNETCLIYSCVRRYILSSRAPKSKGNTFQDLPRLGETADNTERYI